MNTIIEKIMKTNFKIGLSFDEKTHTYSLEREPIKSTSKVLESLKKPFDPKPMAIKCSQNPNHEHFGKTPEQIIELWQSKTDNACDVGHEFHLVAENYLKNNGNYFLDNPFKESDLVLFEKFYRDVFVKHDEGTLRQIVQTIGLEIRIAHPLYRVGGTFDALLQYIQHGWLLIFDWKTNAKFTTTDNYSLIEPYQDFDSSKLTIYTFQTYIYRFILQDVYGIDVKDCRIVWFDLTNNTYQVHKPKFAYNEQFIRSVLARFNNNQLLAA